VGKDFSDTDDTDGTVFSVAHGRFRDFRVVRVQRVLRASKKMSGQATRRHPECPPYRCFLSDLAGFAGLRRAGPTRTGTRIPDVRRAVNVRKFVNREEREGREERPYSAFITVLGQ
jgi:hypothetical protein